MKHPPLLQKIKFLVSSFSSYDALYIKDFHQEFWSGSGEDVINVWVPLNLKKKMGTVEFVKGSHLWGHIKHKDRKPLISIDKKKIYKPKRKRTLQLKHYLWILHFQKRITFYYLLAYHLWQVDLF